MNNRINKGKLEFKDKLETQFNTKTLKNTRDPWKDLELVAQ